MHTVLYTPRLILRPWQESDAADLYRYASDPAVGPAAGWPPHTDEDDSRAVIRDVLMIPGTFAVCRREDGAAIGSVGLKTGDNTDMTDREDECELGYWIGRPYWGQGLIPEAVGEILRHAFEDLGIKTRVPFDMPNTMSTREFQFLGKYLMNEKLFSFHIPRAKIVNICQVTSDIKSAECFESASLCIPYNTDIKVGVEEE